MLYRVYFAHPLQLCEVLIIRNPHVVDEEWKHGDNLSKAIWLFTSRSRIERYVCKNQTRTVLRAIELFAFPCVCWGLQALMLGRTLLGVEQAGRRWGQPWVLRLDLWEGTCCPSSANCGPKHQCVHMARGSEFSREDGNMGISLTLWFLNISNSLKKYLNIEPPLYGPHLSRGRVQVLCPQFLTPAFVFNLKPWQVWSYCLSNKKHLWLDHSISPSV